jgi:uncharacterized membrane protein YbaN (DUF454 family)
LHTIQQRLKECRVHHQSTDATRVATLIGGTSLIAATLLFSAVFVTLARSFGYPEVLDLPAAEVLPRLLALGPGGRAVWVLYGLIPLLLVPTAIGVFAAGRQAAPLLSRAALVAAVLSAVTMMAGLLRWPSLHWQLAQAYADASPGAREAIAATFAAANSYLGSFVGEFLGELFLNAFFLCAAIVLTRSAAVPRRWLLAAGCFASALGGLAMLRNVTSWVEPIAALNNAVLPAWMLVLGVVLLRHRAGAASPKPAPAVHA